MPSPRFVGGVAFDAQTLLAAGATVIVGFQSVIFAFFTKVFATHNGLLPDDPLITRVTRYITLETGLLAGLLLLACGLAGSIYSLVRWSEVSFGALDFSQSLRVVVPSATALIMGSQVILSSFFLSVLTLPRRDSS
jgi:hypothetical protein